MLYSEIIKKASQIAFDAHKNDMDKGGYPYIMHPLYLAFQMEDEDSVCVALLHDVIEDHPDKYSFDYIKQVGFNDNIINALKLLTHEKDTPYMDYIKIIKTNSIATKIKIADLKHNLDFTRIDEKHFYKEEIYKRALDCLYE
ncbi:MAG: GTP pyrophosphokinase [Clostridia bacterium]|nr:GTP pyrophosphokinase [Clostridia bacterium]